MSDISELRRQFGEGHWKKFIKSIKINNLHGWNGQTINFNFPICAIVGENGIGKSTFVKAAACAYQNMGMQTFYPSKMFVKTQWDSQSIENAYIEYNILEGNNTRSTHWKKTNDWGFTPKKNKPKRKVYFLDVSRTLPLDATAGYAKIAKQSAAESANIELNEESISALSYVMGKNYSAARFANTEIDSTKDVGILTNSFGDVSQFHQGAGEDATLDLFKILQEIPEQSLLLIDEVEASLHPMAQRRLIKYLIKLARVKKLQIILSTHSAYVLEEIPEEGRIMLIQLQDRKDILYNVSTKFALSEIDDKIHPELFVFVEDDEAVTLVNQIIKMTDTSNTMLSRVSVKAIGSYTVVNTVGQLLKEGKLPYKGIAIVDGDKFEECKHNCLGLPGEIAPEKYIFEELKAINWNNLDSRFGMGAGSLFKIFEQAMLIPDHHKWTEYIGDQIKYSKDTVWLVMVEEWCKQCLCVEDRENLFNQIINAMNA